MSDMSETEKEGRSATHRTLTPEEERSIWAEIRAEHQPAPARPFCLLSDWNRVQSRGLPLSALRIHATTDFAVIEGQTVLLEDQGEVVSAVIERRPDGSWWGAPDWSTQRPATAEERQPAHHPATW
jgi:hypothetical protein